MTRIELIIECQEIEARASRCCLPAGSPKPINIIQACWFIRGFLTRNHRGQDVKKAGSYVRQLRQQIDEIEGRDRGGAVARSAPDVPRIISQ